MAAKKKIDLSVSLISVDDLAHYERNARTHPQEQIEQIKESIRKFGFANPIIADIDDGGVIAAGHGRHMAVEQMLEAGEVITLPNGKNLPKGYLPVVDCSGWTETQRRAYTLADNKIATNSGWDDDLLSLEIGELLELGAEAAPVIGFSEEEIEGFVSGIGDGSGRPENYSRKIEAPIYEPTGKKPKVSELVNLDRVSDLKKEIDATDLPKEVSDFLHHAAERHAVFDFEKVAEFYAHASEDVQNLMERSALVIIDFQKAIEEGFVELGESVDAAWEADHGDGD